MINGKTHKSFENNKYLNNNCIKHCDKNPVNINKALNIYYTNAAL